MTQRAERYEQTNRAFWDADADDYQAAHHDDISNPAWGAFRIPEAEVRALPDVAGLSVLELGCGGGQASIAFLGDAAVRVGLDLSAVQLRHARRNTDAAGVAMGLACASAVQTPFRDASFDLVFCDHGAMGFCDPALTVPEVARILRPGGRLVFCLSTLLHNTCFPPDDPDAALTDRLQQPMFGARVFDWGDGTIDFQMLHGDWIRTFRASGLVIEDLIELRPPADATSGYDGFADVEWARRWPGEEIWRVRKQR